MSSRRISRRIAALGLLALSGCGFAPVLGGDAALRGGYRIDAPDSVAGFRLQERLEERLGTPASPAFDLAVTIDMDRGPAAINPAGDTTRVNLIGKANWRLTPIGASEAALKGAVEGFTSFAATGSTVATQAAETDARERLSILLADMIVSRLMMHTPDLAQ